VAPRGRQEERSAMSEPSGADGMFNELPLRPPAAAAPVDEEMAALVDKSTSKLKDGLGSTARSLQYVAAALVLVTLLLIAFVASTLWIMASTSYRVVDALESISDSVGPDAVGAAVKSVQHSLSNVEASTNHALSLSSSADDVGTLAISAMNSTAALLRETNERVGALLAHPQMSIALGDAGG